MKVRLEVVHNRANVKRVVLTRDALIGRSTECNLRIAAGQVSRKHCSMLVSERGVFVRDLGSSNGTYIGGRRLEPNVDVPVPPGTELSIGGVRFHVRYELAHDEGDNPQAVASGSTVHHRRHDTREAPFELPAAALAAPPPAEHSHAEPPVASDTVDEDVDDLADLAASAAAGLAAAPDRAPVRNGGTPVADDDRERAESEREAPAVSATEKPPAERSTSPAQPSDPAAGIARRSGTAPVIPPLPQMATERLDDAPPDFAAIAADLVEDPDGDFGSAALDRPGDDADDDEAPFDVPPTPRDPVGLATLGDTDSGRPRDDETLAYPAARPARPPDDETLAYPAPKPAPPRDEPARESDTFDGSLSDAEISTQFGDDDLFDFADDPDAPADDENSLPEFLRHVDD